VNVTDEPYTAEYKTETYGTDYIVNVQLYLGFRMNQQVNVFLRQIVGDLMHSGELHHQPQKYTTMPGRNVGDFSFVLVQEELSPETQINGLAKALIRARLWIQKNTISPARWFGLDYADVVTERVPLVLGKTRRIHLKRIFDEHEDDEN
jgi:KUP system potassium uptake protein